jgi:hypothetical protein
VNTLSWVDRILIVVLSTLALLVPFGGKAEAGQVEYADRPVAHVEVTYVEHVPTRRYQYRRYFETNDGATFRYRNFRHCHKDGVVSVRICRDVFWYAR